MPGHHSRFLSATRWSRLSQVIATLLAKNTSRTLCSVTGKPILEPYLTLSRDADLVGLLTRKECQESFSSASLECPLLGEDFHFYHPDLGPGNIIVSDDGTLAGILGWEAAGYYPTFWFATKPAVSPGLDFCPSVADCADGEWRKRLRIELESWGYPQAGQWFMKWRGLA